MGDCPPKVVSIRQSRAGTTATPVHDLARQNAETAMTRPAEPGYRRANCVTREVPVHLALDCLNQATCQGSGAAPRIVENDQLDGTVTRERHQHLFDVAGTRILIQCPGFGADGRRSAGSGRRPIAHLCADFVLSRDPVRIDEVAAIVHITERLRFSRNPNSDARPVQIGGLQPRRMRLYPLIS